MQSRISWLSSWFKLSDTVMVIWPSLLSEAGPKSWARVRMRLKWMKDQMWHDTMKIMAGEAGQAVWRAWFSKVSMSDT